MPVIRSLLLSAIACLALAPSLASAGSERTVVLMLFDGIAPVYLERFPTPAFDRIRAEGAWTHRMDPAFPTISLINGVTISTGCWPEHHGIVSNLFLDPERGVYDHSIDADWLTSCEHLHQAAERQGAGTAAARRSEERWRALCRRTKTAGRTTRTTRGGPSRWSSSSRGRPQSAPA
jgi:hypothetical protein